VHWGRTSRKKQKDVKDMVLSSLAREDTNYTLSKKAKKM
jgi:hypothetical protein